MRILKFNESLQQENLLIVDVQKSFRKFFSEMFINKLNKYALNFENVYQVFDNHIDGKDTDKSYLYDDDPKIPVNGDLYQFNNQKDIFEKRYNYDVDVDFYKKILDIDVYKKMKKMEEKNTLKKGDFFPTKNGTLLVYTSNNHQFFHVPKKLMKLFNKLKGKHLTVVGGSLDECLLDILTAAESIGVLVKIDYRYVYSASHCSIK